jgi:hypothetical protein
MTDPVESAKKLAAYKAVDNHVVVIYFLFKYIMYIHHIIEYP